MPPPTSGSNTGLQPQEQARSNPEIEPDPLRPLKLLSLDGGGVRGLSSIIILESLMAKVNEARKQQGLHPKEPWQLFDMIGGTSTGGLIAIMLGRLRMSVTDCRRWYLELARSAFTPTASRFNPYSRWFAGANYDVEKLEDAIYRILLSALPEGSNLHNDPQFNKGLKPKPEPQESLLKAPSGLQEGCKVFVVSTKEDNTTAVIFRSYNNPQKEAKFYETCRIWEACRATSAATTYFPPLDIQGEKFLDGGLVHNNPVDLVYSEAMDLWPNTVPLLVSIGTGVAPESAFQGSLLTLGTRLKEIATETEKTHQNFKEGSGRDIVRSNRYFRFNVPAIGAIGLEEWRRLQELEEKTEKYLQVNAAKASACVKKLLEVISQAMKERSQEMVRWISQIPVELDHSVIKQKLEPNLTRVGDWLIDEDFIPWTKSRNLAKPVFWLRGGIGMGKSSLMSKIIDWYLANMQPEDQIAYFYCSTALDGRSDPADILRSLFAQLSCAKDHSVIVPRLQTEFEKRTRTRALTSRLSIEEVKQYFKEVINANQSTITIAIDGLDECSNFNKLLRYLNLLFDEVSGTGTLKMVLSSRMQVNPPRNFPSQKEVIITPDRNAKDIEEYIRAQIYDREKHNYGERLLHGRYQELELEQHLFKLLTTKAQGMFLWAELQLATFFPLNRDLLHPTDVKRKLSILESSNPRSALAPLNQVYGEIYNMNAHPDTEDRAFAQRVYKWMLYAKRNLELKELSEAVSIRVDGSYDPFKQGVTEEYIMKICANFIICSEKLEGGKICKIAQFAHSSVRYYLESLDEYSKGKGNGQIAESCISYLGQVDRRTIEHAYLDEGFPNYALAYWPLHLREACANGHSLPIIELSRRFSDERFGKWIKLLHNVAMNLRHDKDTQGKLLDCISLKPNRLFVGCAWNISTLVEDLIDQGEIDLEERNSNRENALYIASKHGYEPIVSLLLEKGKVDVNPRCGECLGALQVASKNGHVGVVEILLSNGADVKQYNGMAINLAAKEGHEKIVRLFMTNLRDKDRMRRMKKGGGIMMKLEDDISSRLAIPIDEGLGSSIRSTSEGDSDRRPYEIDTVTPDDTDSVKEGFYFAVQEAATSGNHETISILLENAIHIGITETDMARCCNDALEPAALRGHAAVIERLLNCKADPNYIRIETQPPSCARINSQRTPLEIAAEAGHREVVKLLIDAGADIKGYGNTALQGAAIAGYVEIVKLLLNNNAKLSHDNCLNTLQEAAENGYTNIVTLLVEEGQKSGVAYSTVLKQAATDGDENLVNLLLTMNTKQDEQGHQPPVPLLTPELQAEVIEILLKHDKQSERSRPTALQSAAGGGHELIVRLLLDKDEEVNTDPSQESPLQLAAKNGHNIIINLLLDKKADIDAPGPTGTALQLAAESGRDKTVKVLIDRKAKVDAHNGRGTALQLASAAGHEVVVMLLLNHGAGVNASIAGSTALQRATMMGHDAIVETLIARDADVNARGSNNNTILQTAAASGYKKIVKMLLKAGADLNTEGGQYGSALQAAVSEGRVGMVELLLKEEAKDFSEGGKKRWDQGTSSWVQTARVPELSFNQPSPPPQGIRSALSETDQESILVQRAKEIDIRKRSEATQEQTYDTVPQRTRSRHGSQASLSQLKEKYSRNRLSQQSMMERSPISSPRQLSPRSSSPIPANRRLVADAHSHPNSPI